MLRVGSLDFALKFSLHLLYFVFLFVLWYYFLFKRFIVHSRELVGELPGAYS